jgi:hypothetical protein
MEELDVLAEVENQVDEVENRVAEVEKPNHYLQIIDIMMCYINYVKKIFLVYYHPIL